MAKFEIDEATWAALNGLLDRALDLAPAERMAWIDTLGAEYDALKPRLRDLLAGDAALRTSQILDTIPKLPDVPDEEDGSPSAQEGDLVGPYRLLHELGAGGMATVWLAERHDGLIPRPVALKLPRGYWRRATLSERLTRERDILATLTHPNIARLYDAGITAAGQPYLALEYVEGRRIDEFVRDAALDVPQRLALFLQVTDAVAYAHAQLVVHRDLKPSNILVTADGHVRLLDFGIAKLLEQGEARETELTERSGRALTPDYASPEQIAGTPIGTPSDVYSLGVVLYELLTQHRPYRLTRDSRGALEEAILQVDPARPSDVAGERSTKKALRGDLDWIVLKAMAKERDRRYASVAALAADLRRFLRNEPVEASPPSATYRLGKFVRRHRVAVTAAALLVLSLLAGTAGTTAGMFRARRAEAAARTEAATAERYSTFLVDMFEAAAPGNSKGREVTAQELLQRGAARARQELTREPLLEGRLLYTIGWVDTRLGHYAEAQSTLDEAVALARTTGEGGRADLAQALIRRGQNERYLNEPGKAGSDDREALAILERVYGPNDVRLGPAINELGLLLRVSDPEQALRFYRRGYDLLAAAHGDDDGTAATFLQNIGSIHRRALRYRDAKDAYERALPRLRTLFGENDPRVATVLDNLGVVYRGLGDYERAVEMARRGLEVYTAVSGPDHPDVGICWQHLAGITDKLGDVRLAIEQIDRAGAIFEQRLPSGHPFRIRAANDKARFLIELERLDDARHALDAFAVTEAASVETRRGLLDGQVLLAEIERLQGDWHGSQVLAERVLADPAVRGDRLLEADARWAHACALAAQARTADAEAERTRALEIDSHFEQAPLAGVVAHAKYLVCAGDAPGAIALLRDAVAHGFHDPTVLRDPALASLRARPDFAPIAAAVAPRTHPAGAPPAPPHG
jgi:serine/threonine protein kinase/tetratricopeptide (TPR) repeat protein